MSNLTAQEKTLKTEKMNAGRYVYVPVTQDKGFSIGVAIEGIHGYFECNYSTVPTYEEARKWADACNQPRKDRGTLTDQDELEIVASSMRKP